MTTGPTALAPQSSELELVVRDTDAFRGRVVRTCTTTVGVLAVISIALAWFGPNPIYTSVASAIALLGNAAAYALTQRGRTTLAARVFLYGIMAAMLSSLPQRQPYEMTTVSALVFIMAIALGAFLLSSRDVLALVGLSLAMLAVTAVHNHGAAGWSAQALMAPVLSAGLMLVEALALVLFTANARANHDELKAYVADIDAVIARAQRIATGDLSGEVEGASAVSATVRAMLAGLRAMVARAREASAGLAAATQQIAAMARQQEQGAVEQAAAVAEIRATLDALLAAAARVAQRTDEVFRNVEATQKTAEAVAARAGALGAHTRRIAALLDVIRGIATKSELLALNAALEGARAGDAGRGFSLVAGQMQRLAESVMDSVRDVRALTEDIDAATTATLVATEDATRLSAAATAAAAQIGATAQQQKSSTEQVAGAMGDIGEVARQVAAGAGQALAATRDLARLADELNRAVEGFRVEAP